MDICYECQEPTVMKQSTITLTKSGYGSYEVEGVLHMACDKCKAKVIPPNEAKRVEKIGLRLHSLKVLEDKKIMTALELNGAINGDVELLEETINELVKEKLVRVSFKDPKMPTVELITDDNKSIGIIGWFKELWHRIKAWIELNKHNLY